MEQQGQCSYFRIIALDLSLIVLLSLASVMFFLRSNPELLLVFDDSYITLRFAANLFRYNGITYDGSTFLSGATSPLHIVCVALLGHFIKMEEAALATGVIFFVLSSLMVYLWMQALYNRRAALLAGMMTAGSGWLVFDALNGLETTAFIFLSLATFYLYHRCQDKPFYAVPLALSILTRPEGWFVGVSIWAWQMLGYFRKREVRHLRHLLVAIGLCFLLTGPYLILSLRQTGSLLPGTAYTKGIFFGETTMPFINKAGFFTNRFLPFYGSFIYPASLLFLPLVLFAKRVIALPFLWFYFLLFYSTYLFLYPGAIQNYWNRYQHAFIPFVIMAIAGGAVAASSRFTARTARITVVALITAVLLYNQAASFVAAEKTYQGAIRSIHNPQIKLAMWLKRNTPEHALIALHDIGAVGYFSERRVLDLVGLVNLEITGCYLDQSKRPIPLGERRVMDYLKQKRPDYLVIFIEWDRFFNLLQPANSHCFSLIHTTLPLYPTAMRYHVYECHWN